jgi:hypothetical protein
MQVAHDLLTFMYTLDNGLASPLSILLFVLGGLRDLFVSIVTFQWVGWLIHMPMTKPEHSVFLLEEHLWYGWSGIDVQPQGLSTTDVESYSMISLLGNESPLGLNKFGIGLLNSIFLMLPVSLSWAVALRRLHMEGLGSWVAAILGTIAGEISFIACVLFGCQALITRWHFFGPFSYLVGFFMTTIVVLKMGLIPIKSGLSMKKTMLQAFGMNFALSWLEQSTVFQKLQYFSWSAQQTSLLQRFNSMTPDQDLVLHLSYLAGLTTGCLIILVFVGYQFSRYLTGWGVLVFTRHERYFLFFDIFWYTVKWDEIGPLKFGWSQAEDRERVIAARFTPETVRLIDKKARITDVWTYRLVLLAACLTLPFYAPDYLSTSFLGFKAHSQHFEDTPLTEGKADAENSWDLFQFDETNWKESNNFVEEMRYRKLQVLAKKRLKHKQTDRRIFRPGPLWRITRFPELSNVREWWSMESDAPSPGESLASRVKRDRATAKAKAKAEKDSEAARVKLFNAEADDRIEIVLAAESLAEESKEDRKLRKAAEEAYENRERTGNAPEIKQLRAADDAARKKSMPHFVEEAAETTLKDERKALQKKAREAELAAIEKRQQEDAKSWLQKFVERTRKRIKDLAYDLWTDFAEPVVKGEAPRTLGWTGVKKPGMSTSQLRRRDQRRATGERQAETSQRAKEDMRLGRDGGVTYFGPDGREQRVARLQDRFKGEDLAIPALSSREEWWAYKQQLDSGRMSVPNAEEALQKDLVLDQEVYDFHLLPPSDWQTFEEAARREDKLWASVPLAWQNNPLDGSTRPLPAEFLRTDEKEFRNYEKLPPGMIPDHSLYVQLKERRTFNRKAKARFKTAKTYTYWPNAKLLAMMRTHSDRIWNVHQDGKPSNVIGSFYTVAGRPLKRFINAAMRRTNVGNTSWFTQNTFYGFFGYRGTMVKNRIHRLPPVMTTMRIMADVVLDTQPKSHYVTDEQKGRLQYHRAALARYHRSLRRYRGDVDHLICSQLGSAKSKLSYVYRQQFKGRYRVMRRLFFVDSKRWNNPYNEPIFAYSQLLPYDPTVSFRHEELPPVDPEGEVFMSPSAVQYPWFAAWDQGLRKAVLTNGEACAWADKRAILYLPMLNEVIAGENFTWSPKFFWRRARVWLRMGMDRRLDYVPQDWTQVTMPGKIEDKILDEEEGDITTDRVSLEDEDAVKASRALEERANRRMLSVRIPSVRHKPKG